MKLSKLALAVVAILASVASHAQVRSVQGDFVEKPGVTASVEKPAVVETRAKAAPSASDFVLRKGEPIHLALRGWAERAGWELIWQPTVSWRVLRDTAIAKGEFTEAAAEVIEILRDEGKPITLRISEGNKVMEVISQEVRNDVF
jgi:hypothetical protein